ncbi:MAG: phosphoribosyltransferase domain-containing protein [Nakamurella sp.]
MGDIRQVPVSTEARRFGAGDLTSWVSEQFAITMAEKSSPVDLTMRDLLGLALRRNPKRAQLLVSTVLGKHLAADPSVIVGAGRLLGALVAQLLAGKSGPVPPEWTVAARQAISGINPAALADVLDQVSDLEPQPGLLVFGFAETATSVGHLVADQLRTDYLQSTRRADGRTPVAAEFSEPHSHATGHLLRPADPELLNGAGPLILVDDELSTGRTALNVIEALHGVAPRERYVLAGLIDVRSDADDANRAALARRLGCRIDVVSLVRGRVLVPDGTVERVGAELAGRPAAADRPISIPAGAVSRIDVPWPADVPHGGRHGFLDIDRPGFDAAVARSAAALSSAAAGASRVLVLGTEELMYLPLRLAVELDREPHGSVAFQSTTRSPVHVVDEPGYPIRRRVEFKSGTVGQSAADDVTRFVYNASWPDDGTEVRLTEADLIIIVDDGHALNGPDGVACAVAAATGAPVLLAVLS